MSYQDLLRQAREQRAAAYQEERALRARTRYACFEWKQADHYTPDTACSRQFQVPQACQRLADRMNNDRQEAGQPGNIVVRSFNLPVES